MSLTLSITNVDRLDNGVSTKLRLDRHGAVIGRSPHVDWSLPDPRNYVSSVHCEIDYRDGQYTLVDKSTNGTYLNGAQSRLEGPHRISDGDVFLVGHYQIKASLEGGARSEPAAAAPAWSGWDVPASAPSAEASDWARPAPAAAISGAGPMSSHWAAPAAETAASTWATPAAPGAPASEWSSPVGAPQAPSAADVWGRLEAGNEVDWARGFGAPASPPPPPPGGDPFGLVPQPAADPFGLAAGAGSPAAAPPPSSAPSGFDWGSPPSAAAGAVSTPPPAAAPDAGLAALLSAAGLTSSDLRQTPAEVLAAAGAALRRLVGGVVVLLEARARAKQQLGAQGTALELEGNNPLKFARTPEQALAQLLNPPQRGFMPAERAIETAFQDLQAHQMATLAAMQGALRATLARFSPEAIRNRAESGGLLAKILPGAHEATLWRAYEREFEGVARGSDEAFMDVFAKEFREAYERAAGGMQRKP